VVLALEGGQEEDSEEVVEGSGLVPVVGVAEEEVEEEEVREAKPSDMSTCIPLRMRLEKPNHELSESPEETSTSTLSLSEPPLHLLPNKRKSSFQNRINTGTWSTFF